MCATFRLVFGAYVCSSLVIQISGRLASSRNEVVCYDDLGCFKALRTTDGLYRIPDFPQNIGSKFILYTRSTGADNPTVIDETQLGAIDTSKKTIFLIHGWNSNPYTFSPLQSNLLQKFDVNIIGVDWSLGANGYYLDDAVDIQVVARQTGRLIFRLTQQAPGLDPKIVHMIGHSLGAHICGLASKWLKQLTGGLIVGRISALDAAGVWIQDQSPELRLVKTDADFTDAIHTCATQFVVIGGVGTLEPTGHVDFYPNGGREQPQCHTTLFQDPIDAIICDHHAAIDYFAETVTDDCPFTSKPCPKIANPLQTPLYWTLQCKAPCGTDCGRMGYYSNTAPGRNLQYLKTNTVKPYCVN